MQGEIKDWVNYHSQHHRLSDKPGDPHNPHESKAWAWIGWLIWREVPDQPAFIGAAVIISSGLFIIWREHKGKRHPSA